MPSRTPRTPSYRLHKPTGLAVVTLGGRDVYLGRHGSPESRAEYDRVVAEWLAGGRTPPPARPGAADPGPSVAEILLAYLRFARGYYVKNGRPTTEAVNVGLALKPVRQLYGLTPARDFGPVALKAVRKAMIDAGLCRNEVNKRVGKVVRAFKWAVSEELIPASVHHGLQSVAGLRRGRSEARESDPVRPVADADVDAIRAHASRQVWAMVELQRLAGMRPGEVVLMRTADVDTSARVWTYRPSEHKTEHHGRERTIYFGPKAQEILLPWFRLDPAEFLFSPAEATAERKAALRAARKTPVQPSQRDRAKARPRKRPGARYTTDSYRRAISYACDLAGVPRWHPNQLRHNAATRIRREFGLDVARAVLGHSTPVVTEVYAELDGTKAAEAMGSVG